ncbi:PQQ-binding-like beta-propeller repeat protein, partial [Candidatus Bathyarchaeota archaeon]|nr:PQQ-binding-like beta-propeller repeat protein [Candidatus Bathyarchaeota archaeon]
MKISEKAKSAVSIAIIIIMMTSMTLMTTPIKAQTSLPAGTVATNLQEGGSINPLPAGTTPDYSFDTYAQLSFRPNPVGVGQSIIINLWVTPAIHVSRYFKDFKVTITDPDGNSKEIVLNSYRADATAWLEYVFDKVGTWKIKFDFPGGYFPAGNYTTAAGAFGGSGNVSFTESAYYKPASSPVRELIVQQDMVPSWPAAAIPTDYWTRPVHVENREWWTIAGNWPGIGYVGGGTTWDELYPNTSPTWNAQHKFTPWVQGPNSAHVVWKEQGNIAGLIGGQAGQYGNSGGPSNPSIIYAGRAYEGYTKPGTGSTAQNYWKCYDLRTGQVYWDQPAALTTVQSFFGTTTGPLVPNLIEYASPTTSEVPGAEAAGAWSVSLMYLGSGRLYKWNPWTGALTLNTTIGASTNDNVTVGTFYKSSSSRGNDPSVLSIQTLRSTGTTTYRLINWTTRGSSSNFTSRIASNTSYARSSLPSYIDWNVGLGATVAGVTVAGVFMGQNITGYRLSTGEQLWSIIINEPVYSGLCNIVDHGKVAVLSDHGYYVAIDLATGKEAWKSDKMAYPWASTGFGGYSAMSAYGMLFREAYDGVYAFNWTNGKLVWKYTAPAGSVYETPYTDENFTTVMPFYSFGVGGQIADGKFFTWNYEHTESWPVTRGWSLHAIDVFTGKGVWNITGCMAPTNIADGYLVATNSYDGYKYVFGKGETTTTITAPDVAVQQGTSIVIKGTVLD